MYFIVETQDQLCQLSPKDNCFIQVIPSSDRYHPTLSRCSLVYYNDGTKGYIFPINHSEGFSLEIAQIESFINAHKKVYLLDRKFHSYFLNVENSVDVNFIRVDQGIEESKIECDTLLHRDFNQKYSTGWINEIIPIVKHYEKCEDLYNKIEPLFELEADYSILNKSTDAYKWVETQGIKVDTQKLKDAYKNDNIKYGIKDDMAYTYYNMYNITGRPTNSFNSINFVAIPKTQEFRDCFIPENDFMVEFDFDAYHLRLIAKAVEYEFPNSDTSIHEQLGKFYFEKDQLTEEEYSKSKEITFKQLYGGIEDRYKNIEFFTKLDSFIESLYATYKKQGSIKLPTGKLLRRSEDMNKLKLFNYWVQNLETKVNTEKILDIKDYIESAKCKTKLILITYDAFLFDYSIQDGKQFLIDIKNIMQKDGYGVKLKRGTSYFL
jgi:hypothetical protein